MMGCGTFGVAQIMIGLHRVGIVGLQQALKDLDEEGLRDRPEILSFLLDRLAKENYIPDTETEAYECALWREVLRHRGEDFSEFFPTVEVTVSGDGDRIREQFVELIQSVFAEFELRPVVSFADRIDAGGQPVLTFGDHEILRGLRSRQATRLAIRKSFSGW